METTEKEAVPLDTGQTETRLRSHAWLYVWTFIVVILVYVLGLGPAVRLHRSKPAARPVIEWVYAPLVQLCKHSPKASRIVESYLEKVWHVK
jgi:hypothetical protein